jgi:hypothetical protein
MRTGTCGIFRQKKSGAYAPLGEEFIDGQASSQSNKKANVTQWIICYIGVRTLN